jgi:alpha-L-fucosidase
MASKVPSYEERMRWFHKARFGMFIHWGLYALHGQGEWAMRRQRIPFDEYRKLADRFNPKRFDADAWAQLARDAGCKYMVLTTRHHDGFCLFDSQVSDFTSVKTAAGRDFVAEYVKACRKAGLKVGFYYSLLDWRFPGYHHPEKYPASKEALVRQYHEQVRELLSNYGRIDVLWYDGHWLSGHAGTDEDRAAFYRSAEVNRMARKLQPHILINNRSGIQEDLDTPEQRVKASEPGRGWESCMTIGDSCGWGYIKNSPNMKTVPQLLQHLVTAASGEGNFLLNVGPKPDGGIRSEESKRLRAMGEWLGDHGEAIYGSQRCELGDALLGPWTRKGKVGYWCIFRWPGREAQAPLVDTRATSATLLSTGEKLKLRRESNGRLVISGMPARPPHPHVNVIKVRFADEPRKMVEEDWSAWLTGEAPDAGPTGELPDVPEGRS